MKVSEFHSATVAEFGVAQARVLIRDLQIDALGGRTAAEALAAGVEPNEIWLALCEADGVPPERWYGRGLPEPRRR